MDERDEEDFLQRWSRLKLKSRQESATAPSPQGQSEAPVLPALDSLTPDSDFRPFFHPKVDETLRRAALKKLFADPRFNVMDGLDVYIDDYSNGEPLPTGLLEQLHQAQNILRWAQEAQESAPGEAAVPNVPAKAPDEGDAAS